ncbi:FG-GAP repeat protein [Streptomyces venezuelae]|uniref:FG-GAP repeat protein n=1 Tax=Streptomyces venezuelae TaxID=54571 RepID=UPI00379B3175
MRIRVRVRMRCGCGHPVPSIVAAVRVFRRHPKVLIVSASWGRPRSARHHASAHNGRLGGGGSDRFGTDLAHGDLNDDGYGDLVVGRPMEDVESDVDGASVTVLWDSAPGLSGGTTISAPAPPTPSPARARARSAS